MPSKPSNILVMGRGREVGMVKIADFGLARIFQSPQRPLSDNGVVVTVWYRSPELLLGAKHYNQAVDIWAIGCIFSELLTLTPLFPGKENPNQFFQEEQLDRIFKVLGRPTVEQWPSVAYLPEWPRAQTMPQSYETPGATPATALHNAVPGLNSHSPVALSLLSKMIEYDPGKRISAMEALKDPYFTNVTRETHGNAFAVFQDKQEKDKYNIPFPVRRPLPNSNYVPARE